jgi:uncharacterized coiled-coil protein SlyX
MAKTTAQIIAELAAARETMQYMISQGFGLETRALQERRINALKNQLAKAQAAQAQVSSTVFALASELNISVWDLVKTLAKGSGPATRLSARERAVLRTVYGR